MIFRQNVGELGSSFQQGAGLSLPPSPVEPPLTEQQPGDGLGDQ